MSCHSIPLSRQAGRDHDWVQSLLPDSKKGLTLSVDGKTVCSTEKMEKYESPMHIVSAHIAELGITFGQCAVKDKSNEIPAVQELLGLLDIEGCLVVADALNCQKDTANVIVTEETVRNALSMNMDTDTIIKLTGLTYKEVEDIRRAD